MMNGCQIIIQIIIMMRCGSFSSVVFSLHQFEPRRTLPQESHRKTLAGVTN
ncbi:MAG: hypothetical protein JJU32_04265 [Phormidium sp. BM_Day4_Bin.17]|nr:hypothetical protein [Phormidium sp. BM_Day4_Bin.17]UCJ12360.1 MAG: hypothetical protein JWS08_00530 [Phormidium sp. PBR-2020]